MDPKSELAALQAKNNALILSVKASNRELTPAEVAAMEQDADRIIQLKAAIARGEGNAALMDSFNRGTAATEDVYPNGIGGEGAHQRSASGAKGYVTPASLKRMAAAQAANIEAKGLVAAGSNVTPVEFDAKPQVLATPGANLGILDVLAVKTRNSAKYTYVRQTVRTNNADVVPAGSLKPTSVFTVEEVEGSLDVVAHMSEYVGTYLLKDNEALEGFLTAELRAGIFAKVAELAVAEFAAVPGAQTQAFVDSAMDSIYLAASKSAALGYNPDVVLLPRATFDAIMLAKDADGNYLYRKAEDSRINGLHPVVIEGAADQAIVLDSSKVGISVDKQGVETKWDTISRFEYNELRALVEGRFAIDVFAAPAIVVVDTAGA
ncbi:phage major capsid protein [Microbacterium paraoxydans]|uniref:phage major capsid protein n=1 Tax=Microbacterium paraoxydans TaxID=199592 RepID=UPI00228570EE|nr:phage major capsid protein [Microbacterium paraoxydans]MCZ0708744.1 phage major capsid protein [Microbacterium paraoxydans]